MKKQTLYDMFFADPEISHIIKSIPGKSLSTLQRSRIYNRMIMICENLVDGVNLEKVLKRSFVKNRSLWLTGQWISHFSKDINQNYTSNKDPNAWESELEGFIVILTKAGFFSYFNALKSAKTLFKQEQGFYYGREGERVTTVVHIPTSRLIANEMNALLKYGAIFGGPDRDYIKSKIIPYTGMRFENSKGLNFKVEKFEKSCSKNLEQIAITFRHSDYKGNPNLNILKRVKEHLTNVLVRMPHVSNITMASFGAEVYVKFAINPTVEKPVSTSSTELLSSANESKSTITDEDIRAHLENKIVVLSDEIGVLIQERDNISEQINDRSEKLEKIRKIIEVL